MHLNILSSFPLIFNQINYTLCTGFLSSSSDVVILFPYFCVRIAATIRELFLFENKIPFITIMWFWAYSILPIWQSVGHGPFAVVIRVFFNARFVPFIWLFRIHSPQFKNTGNNHYCLYHCEVLFVVSFDFGKWATCQMTSNIFQVWSLSKMMLSENLQLETLVSHSTSSQPW